MNLQPGHLLSNGKYRIVRFIACGGFGYTYEAIHCMLNTKVAIKEFFWSDKCFRDNTDFSINVTNPNFLPSNDKLKKKFVEEASVLFKMHHQSIVRVTDIFEENNTAYYVMDYIEGQSLKDIVNTYGPLDEDTALNYIYQVADALRLVHSNNRLHLDIKPANIMVDVNGNAILIDFGASKQWNDVSGFSSSLILMSKGYAPPEQMSQGANSFSAATDIYALGATLYYLLSGIEPPESSALAIGECSLQPLPESVSKATRDAVYAAMRPKRISRPQNISAFIYILENGQNTPQTPPNNYPNTRQEATVINHTPAKPATTGMGIKIALVCVIIALIAVVAFIFITQNDKQIANENTIAEVDSSTTASPNTANPIDTPKPSDEIIDDSDTELVAASADESKSFVDPGYKVMYGSITSLKGQKCDITMYLNVLSDGHITGKYCYANTINRYGNKPENYIQLSGYIYDDDVLYLEATLYGQDSVFEYWNGSIYGNTIRGTLTNAENGTELPFSASM